MIKKLSIVILLICCCYFYHLDDKVKINAYSEIVEYNNSICSYESSTNNKINVVMEKDHYLSNEEIIINISYNQLEVEPTVSYDSLGFDVIFENIDVNVIIFKLIYNHFSLTPNISLNINDINIKVYGYVDNNYGIFISNYSEDDAAFRYFKYLYENELITLQEFENLVTEQNSKCASINNNVNIQNTYINNSNIQMSSTETDVVVYGAIKWEDERDIIHLYQFMRVDIMDDDVVTNDIICTVYTDETGYFCASFPNTTNEAENGGYDIFLNIYAESENGKVHVRPDTVSFTYKISTKDMLEPVIYNDYIPNNITDLYFGTIVIKMDTDAGQAMQIAQAATIANKYAEEMTIIDVAPVGIVYSSLDDGCYYTSALNLIYISSSIEFYIYDIVDGYAFQLYDEIILLEKNINIHNKEELNKFKVTNTIIESQGWVKLCKTEYLESCYFLFELPLELINLAMDEKNSIYEYYNLCFRLNLVQVGFVKPTINKSCDVYANVDFQIIGEEVIIIPDKIYYVIL